MSLLSSACGAVGRTVAYDTRDSQLKTHPPKIVIFICRSIAQESQKQKSRVWIQKDYDPLSLELAIRNDLTQFTHI